MSYKKDAVNIGVTLSTQLMAAALAMITIIATFAAFVVDNKNVNYIYYTITIVSFLSLIVSIVLGGKGIDKARKNGFNDIWNLTDTKRFFNKQAIFCLVGILFFLISVFLGKEKKDDLQMHIHIIEKKVTKLEIKDSLNNINYLINLKEIGKLNLKIDSLKIALSNKKEQKSVFRKKCCKTIIQNFDSISTIYNNVK